MKTALEKVLIQISKQLIQLNLQQQRLEKRVKEIQRQIEQESRQQIGNKGMIIHYRIVSGNRTEEASDSAEKRDARLKYSTVTIKQEKAYDKSKLPEIGDYVRIINPKTGQPNRETIEGFCTDGKAKIHCARNIVITRQTKNLRYYVFA